MRGRPKKPVKELLSANLLIRLRAAEAKMIKKLAKSEQMGLAEYLRTIIDKHCKRKAAHVQKGNRH